MNKKLVLGSIICSLLLTGCEIEDEDDSSHKQGFNFQSFNLSNIESSSSLTDDDINIDLQYEDNKAISIASIHEYGLDEEGFLVITDEDKKSAYSLSFKLTNANDKTQLAKEIVSISENQLLFAVGPNKNNDYSLDIFEVPNLSSSKSTLTVINYRDLHANYSVSVNLDGTEKVAALAPKYLSSQISVDHNDDYKLDIVHKGKVMSSCSIAGTSKEVNRVVVFSPEEIETIKGGKNCYVFDIKESLY